METLLLKDGDIQLTTITGKDALSQRLKNRLSLYSGEWSLAPGEGMDWFLLREKNTPITEIEKAIRLEILRDTEVIGINSMELIFIDSAEKVVQYKKPLRTIIVNCSIESVYGELEIGI